MMERIHHRKTGSSPQGFGRRNYSNNGRVSRGSNTSKSKKTNGTQNRRLGQSKLLLVALVSFFVLYVVLSGGNSKSSSNENVVSGYQSLGKNEANNTKFLRAGTRKGIDGGQALGEAISNRDYIHNDQGAQSILLTDELNRVEEGNNEQYFTIMPKNITGRVEVSIKDDGGDDSGDDKDEDSGGSDDNEDDGGSGQEEEKENSTSNDYEHDNEDLYINKSSLTFEESDDYGGDRDGDGDSDSDSWMESNEEEREGVPYEEDVLWTTSDSNNNDYNDEAAVSHSEIELNEEESEEIQHNEEDVQWTTSDSNTNDSSDEAAVSRSEIELNEEESEEIQQNEEDVQWTTSDSNTNDSNDGVAVSNSEIELNEEESEEIQDNEERVQWTTSDSNTNASNDEAAAGWIGDSDDTEADGNILYEVGDAAYRGFNGDDESDGRDGAESEESDTATEFSNDEEEGWLNNGDYNEERGIDSESDVIEDGQAYLYKTEEDVPESDDADSAEDEDEGAPINIEGASVGDGTVWSDEDNSKIIISFQTEETQEIVENESDDSDASESMDNIRDEKLFQFNKSLRFFDRKHTIVVKEKRNDEHGVLDSGNGKSTYRDIKTTYRDIKNGTDYKEKDRETYEGNSDGGTKAGEYEDKNDGGADKNESKRGSDNVNGNDQTEIDNISTYEKPEVIVATIDRREVKNSSLHAEKDKILGATTNKGEEEMIDDYEEEEEEAEDEQEGTSDDVEDEEEEAEEGMEKEEEEEEEGANNDKEEGRGRSDDDNPDINEWVRVSTANVTRSAPSMNTNKSDNTLFTKDQSVKEQVVTTKTNLVKASQAKISEPNGQSRTTSSSSTTSSITTDRNSLPTTIGPATARPTTTNLTFERTQLPVTAMLTTVETTLSPTKLPTNLPTTAVPPPVPTAPDTLVSVVAVIDIFKRETILQAISSVISQTHKNLEVIIVDISINNEKSSMELERMFADSQQSIIIKILRGVAGKSENIAYGRNHGVAHSTGEFIAFLDYHDAWLPTKLEEQLKFTTKDNNFDFSTTEAYSSTSPCRYNDQQNSFKAWDIGAIAQGNYFPLYLNGKYHDQLYTKARPQWRSRGKLQLPEPTWDLELIEWNNCILASNVLIRKPLFDSIDAGFNEDLSEEKYDFWLRVMRSSGSPKVGYLSKPLSIYDHPPCRDSEKETSLL